MQIKKENKDKAKKILFEFIYEGVDILDGESMVSLVSEEIRTYLRTHLKPSDFLNGDIEQVRKRLVYFKDALKEYEKKVKLVEELID